MVPEYEVHAVDQSLGIYSASVYVMILKSASIKVLRKIWVVDSNKFAPVHAIRAYEVGGGDGGLVVHIAPH